MKINIIAVGKLKEKYFRDSLEEYSKRISRFAKLDIIEVAESKNAQRGEAAIRAAKDEEGEAIISMLKGITIALDSKGALITSEELAELVKNAKDYGQEMSFAIGGSDGLSEKLLTLADKRISFGRVTYPHQLMRVILAEQLYRAFTIINSMPYHK